MTLINMSLQFKQWYDKFSKNINTALDIKYQIEQLIKEVAPSPHAFVPLCIGILIYKKPFGSLYICILNYRDSK